jgi:putative DNA primase/helicase
VPTELDDRQADNWRPLLAIADAAGGVWPDRARCAARTLSGPIVEADTAAPVQLLADLQDFFTTTRADKLATATIIRHLTTLEERPWAEYGEGVPLTPRHLAKLLAGFRIKARQIRQGVDTHKGYLRADFTDAFRRYLPRSRSATAQGRGGARRIVAAQEGFG